MEVLQDMEIEGLKEEEDDCVHLDESFFVNDSYRMRTFTYGSQVLRLLCLESASTDYDLTGQLVWPGAELLNHFLEKNSDFLIGRSMIELGSGIADYDLTGQLVWPGAELLNHFLEKNSDFLIGRSMIELGSGIGVTGLLCSRFCRQVVMTDHNEIVLKVLKQNIDLQLASGTSSCSEVLSEKLEWGNHDQLSQILKMFPEGFDLIIGADICFQQSSIPLLFNTVEHLLRFNGKSGCKFILAYVSRAKSIDAMVAKEADAHGLKIHEIPGSRAMVAGGSHEGVIFEFVLH